MNRADAAARGEEREEPKAAGMLLASSKAPASSPVASGLGASASKLGAPLLLAGLGAGTALIGMGSRFYPASEQSRLLEESQPVEAADLRLLDSPSQISAPAPRGADSSAKNSFEFVSNFGRTLAQGGERVLAGRKAGANSAAAAGRDAAQKAPIAPPPKGDPGGDVLGNTAPGAQPARPQAGAVSGAAVKRLASGGSFQLRTTFSRGMGTSGGAMKPLPATLRMSAQSISAGFQGKSKKSPIGQLRLTEALSTLGARAKAADSSAATAAAAFEGKALARAGAALRAPAAAGAGSAGKADAASARGSAGAASVGAPAVGPGQNVTPYQPQMDKAKKKGDESGNEKLWGMILLGLGLLLIAIGVLMISEGMPWLGGLLLAGGIALTIVGIVLLTSSEKKKEQAKKQARTVGGAFGQPGQGLIAEKCVEMAQASGKSVGEVCP